MVRRSVLFTPGDRPEMMRKAAGTGADVVVFDLEDAVALQRRTEAREAVHEVLADPEFDPDGEVGVRVTRPDDAAETDLDVVLGADPDAVRLDAVVLPKVESRADVESVSAMLADRDVEVAIFALVESARGVLVADEIADAPATDALLFGAEDFAADVGANRTPEGTEVLYARERVVVAAAAAGIDAIDTVYTDFEDEEGLRADAEFASDLGYDGKLAIHPSQVGPIDEAFAPSAKEVSWAREVLEAKRKADAEDRGVFRVRGEMIDAPLVARAERILARATAAEDDE